MAVHARYQPRSAAGRFIHSFEETAIAVLLGAMTLLTFYNVVLRYGFSGLNLWSFDVTKILFAWLVLLGVSYGFKVTIHLGVDAVLNVVSPGLRRAFGILAAAACLAYVLLMLKGAWDFWAPFAGLDKTAGRWFPTGFVQTRTQAYNETGQVPMLSFLRWLEPVINDGDRYSKMPSVVPYMVLPLALLLMLVRVVEASLRLLRGEQDTLIVSHEAEDAVEDARQSAAKEG